MLRKLLVVCVLFTLAPATAAVATISDVGRCIQVSATVSRTPATITLSWPSLPESTHTFLIYRKPRYSKSWGSPIATIPSNSTSYVDTNVAVGDAYEYMILGSSTSAAQEVYASYGFIYAGIDFPMIDNRGKLILIVDNTYAAALDNELSRLQQDLTGDGWTVIRHNISRTQTVTSVKALIQADYFADPTNVKAVFLFGRVPVPYSGNCANVKHEENIGAAEADLFYADMDGVWTDTLVNHTGAGYGPNFNGDTPGRLDNVPGDGKYDQSAIPTDTELQIGRVDLSSMGVLGAEQPLLKQYLDKDHNFRTGGLVVGRAGKIVQLAGGGFTGFRNFSAFFGASNITVGTTWFPPTSSSYLWGSVGNMSGHTNTSGLYTTSSFLTDPKIVFTIAGGSYQGDWDFYEDLLRAPLCTTTYGLGSIADGPYEFFHVIALGDTVGSGAWLKQNYDSFLYQDRARTDLLRDDGRERNVWINWMGDPTLRLNPVIPPSALTATAADATTVSLAWTASTDTAIQGYLVYRAQGFGAFTKLTATPIAGTSYTDSSVPAGAYTYMVRAVKLETNGSGTYYNPSQGIFQTVNVGSSAPAVAIVSPLNQFGYLSSSTVVIRASVNPGYAGSVDFYNGAVKIGTAASAPYTYTWNSVPAGTYTLTAQVSDANGTTVSAPVTISVAPLPFELPAPWIQAEVGATGLQGSASVASGNFTVTGAGVGITGSADAFHAVYQPLNVNGSIVAKVTSMQNPGNAGVFIRNSLSVDSQGAALCISNAGTVTLSKRLTSAGAVTTETDPLTVALPCWVKITRAGDTITAYRSSDGSAWVQVGTAVTIPMGQTPEVGLASFSGSSGVSCSSTFSNVSAVSPLLGSIVQWKTPFIGDAFNAGTTVTPTIEKPDSPDSLFNAIAFFDGATQIGTTSTSRNVSWVPSTPGVHTITVNITDLLGVVGTGSVDVTINPSGSTMPTVALTSVIDGQVYVGPCDVTLAANATPASGKTIARVDFWVDGVVIATDSTSPYSVTWANVQSPSIHAVSARAIDSAGVVSQSYVNYLYFNDPQVQLPPAATPTFSPDTGTYSSIQTVSIGCATSGVNIRYTTDGSSPSRTVGTIYSGPIQISGTTTLKAIAYGASAGDSDVASATYTIVPVQKDKLSDVKSLANGCLVSMTSVKVAEVASGVYADGSVYVSDLDRTGGLKVLNAGSVNLGDSLTLAGVTDTDSATGERILRATSVTKGATAPLAGLGTLNKVVTSCGRLVTVWGKVTGVSSSSFTIDDGSGLPAIIETDGLVTPLSVIPTVGDYISATGPAALMAGGATAVRVRSQADIQDCTKCSVPAFSPAAGTYGTAQTVTISTNTGGATIRYTTDGSDPSQTNGTLGKTVTIGSNTTLKAIAYKSGLADSAIASGVYQFKCATPTFSPLPGSYSSPQTVTISCATPGATIRYTTDGSTPSQSNGTVGASVLISADTTLKAIAYTSGPTDSDIASGFYHIYQIVCATPTFSVPAGTYGGIQTVTISTTTPGATIRYTIDGSTPSSTNGTVGTTATITSSCTLKAIAYMAGAIDSGVASATYTITTSSSTYDIAHGLYVNTRMTPDTTWQGKLATQTGSDGWYYRIDTTSTAPNVGTYGANYAFPTNISSYPICPIVWGPGSASYAYGWGGQTATGSLNMQKGLICNSNENASFQVYQSTQATCVGFMGGWQTAAFPTMVVEWRAPAAGTASANFLCYSQSGSNQGAGYIMGVYRNGVFGQYLASTNAVGQTNYGAGSGSPLAASGIAMNAGDSIVIVCRSAQYSIYGTRQMNSSVSGSITFAY